MALVVRPTPDEDPVAAGSATLAMGLRAMQNRPVAPAQGRTAGRRTRARARLPRQRQRIKEALVGEQDTGPEHITEDDSDRAAGIRGAGQGAEER